MPSGTITQPLKWAGGKNYLAERIIALMPKHVHYVEPFFGGGAVLLQKDPQGVSEVVNDLNCQLTNFWHVLQSAELFAEFVRLCQATPFSELEWIESDLADANPNPLANWAKAEEAHRFFIRCRQSRSGMFKDFATLSRTRTRSGMNEQASAWLNAVEGLPAVHARLKRVVILNRPAVDVIRQQDGPATVFYCDPPYVHGTRATKDLYAHEMTDAQHCELLEALAGIQGKFLLSGYPNSLYDPIASRCGWTRHDFEIDNKLSGSKTKAKEIEAVWCNF